MEKSEYSRCGSFWGGSIGVPDCVGSKCDDVFAGIVAGNGAFAGGICHKGERWNRRWPGIMRNGAFLRVKTRSGGIWYGTFAVCPPGYDSSGMQTGWEKNGTSLSSLSLWRISIVFIMVKGKQMQRKASMTVEAALLCPFLCLLLCGMIVFTLQLYQRVEDYAGKLVDEKSQELTSPELIRLEAVTEDLF